MGGLTDIWNAVSGAVADTAKAVQEHAVPFTKYVMDNPIDAIQHLADGAEEGFSRLIAIPAYVADSGNLVYQLATGNDALYEGSAGDGMAAWIHGAADTVESWVGIEKPEIKSDYDKVLAGIGEGLTVLALPVGGIVSRVVITTASVGMAVDERIHPEEEAAYADYDVGAPVEQYPVGTDQRSELVQDFDTARTVPVSVQSNPEVAGMSSQDRIRNFLIKYGGFTDAPDVAGGNGAPGVDIIEPATAGVAAKTPDIELNLL